MCKPQLLNKSTKPAVSSLEAQNHKHAPAESQHFNLTALVSFEIQYAGVEPKQWKVFHSPGAITICILVSTLQEPPPADHIVHLDGKVEVQIKDNLINTSKGSNDDRPWINIFPND